MQLLRSNTLDSVPNKSLCVHRNRFKQPEFMSGCREGCFNLRGGSVVLTWTRTAPNLLCSDWLTFFFKASWNSPPIEHTFGSIKLLWFGLSVSLTFFSFFFLAHCLPLSLTLIPCSNLEAAELLKRVVTSFWINMSLICEHILSHREITRGEMCGVVA